MTRPSMSSTVIMTMSDVDGAVLGAATYREGRRRR